MKTKLSMIAVAALAMAACGPASKVGGGKAGAASAASALSAPTKQAADRASTPADLSDLTYTCAKGGTAKMSNFKADIDTTNGTTVIQTYSMALAGCGLASSEAGVALYNGTVQVSQKIITNSAGVQVEQHYKGRVTLDGAYADFLDTDVSQTVDVGSLGKQGNVSVVMKGTVTNTSGTYSYNESVNVTNGTLSIDGAGTK